MAEGGGVSSQLESVACWLSSAPVRVSLTLGSDVAISRTWTLPDARCAACRPAQPSSLEALEEQALPGTLDGLAGELRRRIGALPSCQ